MTQPAKHFSQQPDKPGRRGATLPDAVTGKARRRPPPPRLAIIDTRLSSWYHSTPGPVTNSAIKAKAAEFFREVYQDQPLPKFGFDWLWRWKCRYVSNHGPISAASPQEVADGGEEGSEHPGSFDMDPSLPTTTVVQSFDSGTTIPDTPPRSSLDATPQETVEETGRVTLWLSQTLASTSHPSLENTGSCSNAAGDSMPDISALEEHDLPMPDLMEVDYYGQQPPSFNFPVEDDNESLASTQIIDE